MNKLKRSLRAKKKIKLNTKLRHDKNLSLSTNKKKRAVKEYVEKHATFKEAVKQTLPGEKLMSEAKEAAKELVELSPVPPFIEDGPGGAAAMKIFSLSTNKKEM